MNRNPLRQRHNGGGKPYSLLNAQRDVTVNLVGLQDRPKTILCTAIESGESLLVDEGETYAATYYSFSRLDKSVGQSIVMRELLASGATLATTRALFRQEIVR